MKIHYIGRSAGEGADAIEAWKKEGLIPYRTKMCTGTMLRLGNEKYFSDDMDKVTCKLCLRMWNKYVRENK